MAFYVRPSKNLPAPTYYSVQQRRCHTPYTVHVHNRETDMYQSYLMVFAQKSNAVHVARVLEASRRENGVWPSSELSAQRPLQIHTQGALFQEHLDELGVKSWNRAGLSTYCAKHMLHLMVIQNRTAAHEDDRPSIEVSFVHFTYPVHYLQRQWDSRYWASPSSPSQPLS